MYTLVLLIPFNSGSLLISDRQSTRYDGTREPWDKIYRPDGSTVIGFSGNSEASRFVAQSLSKLSEPFPTRYVVAYQSLVSLHSIEEEREIEALCVTRQNNKVQAYKFTRSLWNPVVSQNPTGIGVGEYIIAPQIDRPTNHLNLRAAIDFGKALIQYASMVDTKVGPPSQYGFCSGSLAFQGKASLRRLPPENIPIDRMLYPL